MKQIPNNSSSPLKRRLHQNYTALRHAIKNLDLPRVQELVCDGNVNLVHVKTNVVVRIFKHAVKKNNVELVRMIIERVPTIKMFLIKELMCKVLDNDSLAIAELLIEAGINVNIINDEGLTLLHVLVSSKDPKRHELAIQAIRRGAEINTLDAHSRTSVLEASISSKSTTLIRALIKFGADMNALNAKSQTALYAAARSPAAAEVLPAFIDAGDFVPKYMKRRRAADALCYLTKMGADTIPAMEVVLKMGLNVVDHPNRLGVTALNYAVQNEKLKKVKLLLSYGADLEKRDNFYEKPLWKAARLQSCRISALLIYMGADIHARNGNLQCPLHAACRHNSAENVRLLLRLGANVNVTNRNGYTPFAMMKNPASTEAGRLMIQHFAFLTMMGEDINEMDLLAIYFDKKANHIYYMTMFNLADMMVTEMCDGIMYDCLFTKSVKQLSYMARSEAFMQAFYRGKELFPWVFPEMLINMNVVIKRRNFLLAKEQELIEIFGNILPYIFLKSLANHLCYNDLLNLDEQSRYLLML